MRREKGQEVRALQCRLVQMHRYRTSVETRSELRTAVGSEGGAGGKERAHLEKNKALPHKQS
jgi:hypothetical protein